MNTPEHRALIGALLAEDYATVTENKAARFLFSEMIADILHDAASHGQDAAKVLNRALRMMSRDGGSVDMRGEREHRIEVAPAEAATEVVHERVVEREVVVVEEPELHWEEPPPAVERATPHWEEPPDDLGTRTRGRFQRFEAELRANPGRPARIADNVSSSYASGLRAKYGNDFEFTTQRMRRNDKRSYRVWARFVGKPDLKCHKGTA